MYRTRTHFMLASDGTRIAYHVHLPPKSKPLSPRARRVVLTNGIGTTENFWRYLVDALTPEHQIVHWDYRGHGQSETARQGGYAITTQADDLIRIVQETAVAAGKPPLHVAFSMGVPVVLEAYRRHPELFGALVLIAGSPEPPWAVALPFRLPGALRAFRLGLKLAQPMIPVVAPAVHWVITSPAAYPIARAAGVLRPRAPKDDIAQMMQGLRRMAPMAYWKTLIALFESSSLDVLPRVKVPTLVIALENDLFVPLKQIEQLKERLPGARYAVLADAGHAGMLEAGDELVAEITTFLRGL